MNVLLIYSFMVNQFMVHLLSTVSDGTTVLL